MSMKSGWLCTWVALLLFPATLFGQVTSQGNFIIGSSIGLATSSSEITLEDETGDAEGDGPSSTQISFSPSVGYFPLENVVVGIRMDYSFSEVKEPDENRNEDSDLLFGPFSRYYFPVGEDMAFLFEAGFGFGNSNDQKEIAGSFQSINTNIFSLSVGPGFTIISNESIGIEALFKYNYSRSDFDTEIAGVRRETKTITNRFDISIGIQFYLTGFQKAEPDFMR